MQLRMSSVVGVVPSSLGRRPGRDVQKPAVTKEKSCGRDGGCSVVAEVTELVLLMVVGIGPVFTGLPCDRAPVREELRQVSWNRSMVSAGPASRRMAVTVRFMLLVKCCFVTFDC